MLQIADKIAYGGFAVTGVSSCNPELLCSCRKEKQKCLRRHNGSLYAVGQPGIAALRAEVSRKLTCGGPALSSCTA